MKETMVNQSYLLRIGKVLTSASMLVLLASQQAKASWLDDFMADGVATHSASFQSQTTNYYVAGGYTQRIRLSSDPLLSISLPRVSVGCGGIDTFFGGVGFLNEEYLVQKAEGVLKAAPYVALSLALKSLSTQFGDTIESVQSITDQLNQLTLDDCSAAKGLFTMNTALPSVVEEFEQLGTAAYNMGSGFAGDWTDFTSKLSSPTTAIAEAVKKNEATITDVLLNKIMTEDGYLLNSLADSGFISKNEVNVMRALFGDIKHLSATKGTMEYIAGCASGISFRQFYLNDIQKQEINATTCSVDSTDSMYEQAYKTITSIIEALSDDTKRKSAINAEMIKFINSSELPIYSYLATASLAGASYLESQKPLLAEFTAVSYANTAIKRLNTNLHLLMNTLASKMDSQQNSVERLYVEIDKYNDIVQKKLEFFSDDYDEVTASLNQGLEALMILEEKSNSLIIQQAYSITQNKKK